jgi:hypothetical protein
MDIRRISVLSNDRGVIYNRFLFKAVRYKIVHAFIGDSHPFVGLTS